MDIDKQRNKQHKDCLMLCILFIIDIRFHIILLFYQPMRPLNNKIKTSILQSSENNNKNNPVKVTFGNDIDTKEVNVYQEKEGHGYCIEN
jgi:hypothetical protein